jgi:hypothetical protein
MLVRDVVFHPNFGAIIMDMVVGCPFDGRLISPSHHGKRKDRFADGISKMGLEANDLIGYQVGKQIENAKGLDADFGYDTGFLSDNIFVRRHKAVLLGDFSQKPDGLFVRPLLGGVVNIFNLIFVVDPVDKSDFGTGLLERQNPFW